jgi:hypothetical protein
MEEKRRNTRGKVLLTIHIIDNLAVDHLVKFTALMLSCKHLDNAIATRADDKPSIAAPADVTDTFAPHSPVRHDILGADSLL